MKHNKLNMKENKLVFIQKNDVFTDSKIIADGAEVSHKQIKRMIRKHKKDIEFFGKLSVACVTESTGGRPEELQPLNEQQATFIITLLKNTQKVLKFKKELVRQFFDMREELRNRQKLIPIHLDTRRTLTDAIQSLPDSAHKNWKYKHYTDLIYKIVLGKTSLQIRKELGLSNKQSINNFLPYENIKDIIQLEEKTAELLIMGFTYEQIKNGLIKLYENSKKLIAEAMQYKLVEA